MATATRSEIPELVDGECLDAAEFERRDAVTAHRKVELIDGVVYVASPVSYRHGQPHASATFWIGSYCMGTPGVEMALDATVRLGDRDRVRPDVQLRIATGGRSALGADGYVEGPPELVIEVAVSSVAIDVGAKAASYRRAGVLEYLVWRVPDGAVDWFVLAEGRYDRLGADPDGLIRSRAFPGLLLDPAALIRDDLAGLAGAVGRGLATAEHAAFVAGLAAAGGA